MQIYPLQCLPALGGGEGQGTTPNARVPPPSSMMLWCPLLTKRNCHCLYFSSLTYDIVQYIMLDTY